MPNNSSTLVFAYGSNLHTGRMRFRAPSAAPVTIGYVTQRTLAFHKLSEDGSGKADAVASATLTDRVWGVVYRLHAVHKPILDKHEFLGVGYDEQLADVVHKSGNLRAWMYVARPEVIDTTLLPYSWYHDYVVGGAREHRLPESYIAYLREFESVADPDTARQAEHHRLLEGRT